MPVKKSCPWESGDKLSQSIRLKNYDRYTRIIEIERYDGNPPRTTDYLRLGTGNRGDCQSR
ncbi:hypothetical protein MICAI_3220011 [Microcystis sp. T1-4]|nr:hypothetical protein MICAI_3220011 [Microcystis sp. T1-4]